MKITRILPRFLAIGYQEQDIRRLEGKLAYHKAMSDLYEQLLWDGQDELRRLDRVRKDESFFS